MVRCPVRLLLLALADLDSFLLMLMFRCSEQRAEDGWQTAETEDRRSESQWSED